MDLADKYMTESYVQHNPNVPTGRAAFVAFFTQFVKPKAIQPTIQAPVVTMVAEGDKVIISFVRMTMDPKDAMKNISNCATGNCRSTISRPPSNGGL